MAENNLTSNELYFQQEEEEQGINLTLEENLQNNLVALINIKEIGIPKPMDIRSGFLSTHFHTNCPLV